MEDYYGGGWYYDDFEVDVARSGSDWVELEFDSRNTSDNDFTMDCDVRGNDEMRCDGDSTWSGYDFEWERD